MSTAEDFEPDCFVIDSDEEEIPLYSDGPKRRSVSSRMCEKLSKMFKKRRSYSNVMTVQEPY